MNDKDAKLSDYAGNNAWMEMQAGEQQAKRSRDGLGRPAAVVPKLQDAVVVFLSLAARYFDCMYTKKFW